MKAGPISNVVCPGCKRSLDDVIESMVRQRGKFKAQREEARREADRLRNALADLVSFAPATLASPLCECEKCQGYRRALKRAKDMGGNEGGKP